MLVDGDRTALTAERDALFRLHRDGLVAELRRERADGAMLVGRTWSISPRILELGPEELDACSRELVTASHDDPATPEEGAALSHARWVRAVDTQRSINGE
jgi:hypothetical protein